MSAIPLESLASCFQGLVPAWLYTCSRDGVPNVAILSHVDYVDSRHVALSYQFFNKSKRNIAENPQAMVRLYDPDTLQVYVFRLRFVRSETEGPTFESMRLRIEAIASHTGLKGIFKLIAADIYEVESVALATDELGAPEVVAAKQREAARPPAVPFTLKALHELSERIHRASSLEGLLDSMLETIEQLFGFRHSMILLAGEHPDRLVTIASRGYPEHGVGSEIGFSDGIIGMVAEARKPIRVSGLLRHMLYAFAVAKSAREHGLSPDDRRIPLPGLPNPESQLGIPILARDELLGVLCIESDRSYRFHEEDKAYLEVLGGYLAIAIQNALLRERSEESEDPAPAPPPPATAPPAGAGPLEVAYYKSDECILVNDEYLVRSLPAKILWKLLGESRSGGRKEFTNRQLRLDKSLSLPAFKDNLESRLILLRRRLEQRCPDLRIVPSGRGRFLFELGRPVALVERP
ncbi:MAG TPA: GAF domain-containing protein [Candidatus Polarisedimenticolaceae bacterium]|nr:GAF domain-containing protein [Candidatus Polarisedimenticolaceae bacterium]